MEKIIVVARNDGGCSITRPAPSMYDPQSRDRQELEARGIVFNSDDDVLQWIKNKDAPTGRITDISNIPSDRTFRNAWTDDNPTETVDVDMVKARVIHMNNLRALRAKKFEQLGFPVQPSSEIEALLSMQTQALLQELRDMPQTYDLSTATTPEQLKSMIPVFLTN